jgi:hypothetical protein
LLVIARRWIEPQCPTVGLTGIPDRDDPLRLGNRLALCLLSLGLGGRTVALLCSAVRTTGEAIRVV